MSSVSSTSSNSNYYAMQKKAFDKLDTDANGALDEDELLAGKPKTMTKDQVSKLYDTLDTSKSGGVTMDEFAAGTQSGPGMGLLAQLSSDALDVLIQLQQQGGVTTGGGGSSGRDSASDAAYDTLDTNKDGVVSEEEFLAAHPETVSNEEAKKLFETMDTDKDGSIDQDQFKQITDATTPPRLMGPSYFGIDYSQSDDGSSSFGGMASLFGNRANGANSAYRLFELLDNEAADTTTSAA